MDAKNVIIAVLIIAVAVLGYLYYESSQRGISINAPGVKIDAR